MPAPYCYDYPRPAVTVDLVVFTLIGQELRALFIRRGKEPYAGRWAIPGGFMEIDEPVEDAARRELREETGLAVTGPLASIGTYSRPGRDPRGRTLSVAFAAVIRAGQHQIQAGDDASAAEWLELSRPLELAFDHAEILDAAKSWLRHQILDGAGALGILSVPFTATDVLALFRQTGLSRRQASGWLQRMRRSGRITPVEGDESRFQPADSAT